MLGSGALDKTVTGVPPSTDRISIEVLKESLSFFSYTIQWPSGDHAGAENLEVALTIQATGSFSGCA